MGLMLAHFAVPIPGVDYDPSPGGIRCYVVSLCHVDSVANRKGYVKFLVCLSKSLAYRRAYGEDYPLTLDTLYPLCYTNTHDIRTVHFIRDTS